MSKKIVRKNHSPKADLRTRQTKPIRFRSFPADHPIYKEGWTVFTPQGFRKPSELTSANTGRKPARGRKADDAK